MRNLFCFLLVIALVAGASPANGQGAGGHVEVIVNSALYAGGGITANLNRYRNDLSNQGYTTTLTTIPFASPADLRSHLATSYSSGISGAVLVGDMPHAMFQFGTETFATDLYYMDVNGSWSDVSGNGTLDTHTGTVAPDIWVSRMTVSPLVGLHAGRTEVNLLNSYFDRNHEYRMGNLTLSPNGLAYIDDDWVPFAESWGWELGLSLSGSVDIITGNPATSAGNYMNRIGAGTSPGYESVHLAAHSWATAHEFERRGTAASSFIQSNQLAALNPQAFFYNLFACENSDYTSAGYMGGEYVFGTDMGLLAVGSTKAGGMWPNQTYYQAIGNGATFGEAYFDWWMTKAAGGFSGGEGGEVDWFYGMTLLGDGLLYSQAYQIPEPGTLALFGLSALILQLCRRRLAKGKA